MEEIGKQIYDFPVNVIYGFGTGRTFIKKYSPAAKKRFQIYFVPGKHVYYPRRNSPFGSWPA